MGSELIFPTINAENANLRPGRRENSRRVRRHTSRHHDAAGHGRLSKIRHAARGAEAVVQDRYPL